MWYPKKPLLWLFRPSVFFVLLEAKLNKMFCWNAVQRSEFIRKEDCEFSEFNKINTKLWSWSWSWSFKWNIILRLVWPVNKALYQCISWHFLLAHAVLALPVDFNFNNKSVKYKLLCYVLHFNLKALRGELLAWDTKVQFTCEEPLYCHTFMLIHYNLYCCCSFSRSESNCWIPYKLYWVYLNSQCIIIMKCQLHNIDLCFMCGYRDFSMSKVSCNMRMLFWIFLIPCCNMWMAWQRLSTCYIV